MKTMYKYVVILLVILAIILSCNMTSAYSGELDPDSLISFPSFIENGQGTIEIDEEETGYRLYYQVLELQDEIYQQMKDIQEQGEADLEELQNEFTQLGTERDNLLTIYEEATEAYQDLIDSGVEGTELEKDQVEYVQLQGWVRTNRSGKNVSFIALNDGTYFQNAQIVYSADTLSNYAEVTKYLTGTAISVIGRYVVTPGSQQPFEIQATEINLEGACDNTYPLQKKRHSFEYLREIGHLRPRANTFMAVFRVRSALAMAIHQFFQDQGFVYVNTPLITGADAEGAGETFTVTTRDDADYEKDFFGKHASLTVSGQLQAEVRRHRMEHQGRCHIAQLLRDAGKIQCRGIQHRQLVGDPLEELDRPLLHRPVPAQAQERHHRRLPSDGLAGAMEQLPGVEG